MSGPCGIRVGGERREQSFASDYQPAAVIGERLVRGHLPFQVVEERG